MRDGFDMSIHIRKGDGHVVVEQRKTDGVVSTKNIAPSALSDCILNSRCDDAVYSSGLLPEGCISVKMSKQYTTFFIRYPELYADFTYQGTQYLRFPIPRLVFAFQYMPAVGKVGGCSLCVVKDEKLTLDTPVFWYPFSNVGDSGHICTGNNVLPVMKDSSKLHALAGYILRLPNNNDHYNAAHNKLGSEFRDLLEHLKDKDPAYYYSDILVENHQTLKDFLNGR